MRKHSDSETNGARSRRFRRFGSIGFSVAVFLLMLLPPANAGAPVAHPNTVVSAPYRGTVSSPSLSTVAAGCAVATAVPAKWSGLTGVVHTSDSISAKTCLPIGGLAGGGGGGGTGTSSTGVSVAIPFTVGSNGSHTVGSTWTVTIATVQLQTSGGCPTSRVRLNPPLGTSQASLCQDSAGFQFTASAALMDTSDFTWTSFNQSSANSYNSTGWENYTLCYNYGTPTCGGYTGPTGAVYSTGSNNPGFAGFTFSGTTTFTLWNNGTAMVAGHHYLLVVSMGVSATAYASMSNLKAAWTASATASINMASLGNGATLNSVTIG